MKCFILSVMLVVLPAICQASSAPQPIFHLAFEKIADGNMIDSAFIQISQKYKDKLKGKNILVPSKYGSAFYCGGESQFGYFLKLEKPPIANIQFSITCWFQSRQSQWATCLFSYKEEWKSPRGFSLRLNGTELVLYVVKDGKEHIACSVGKNNPVQKGMWYFLAVTWDGMQWKMFLNGTESESGSPETQFFLRPKPELSLSIGGYNVHTNNIFQGLLDELKIYDKAISKEQIFEMLEEEIGQ